MQEMSSAHESGACWISVLWNGLLSACVSCQNDGCATFIYLLIMKNNLNTAMVDFQQKWEGTTVDLPKLVMILDASKTALKLHFKSEPTPTQVIEFSKVVQSCSVP